MLIQYGKVSASIQEYTWNQPTLTSNGNWGTDEFAVKASAVYSTHYVYCAFDGNSSTHYCASNTPNPIIYMYSKKALKISQVKFTGYSSGTHQFTWNSAELYGSNDENTWTLLGSNTSNGYSSTTSWYITSNKNAYYNYFKIQTNADFNGTAMNQIDITATYRTQVANTIIFPTSFSSTNYGCGVCPIATENPIWYITQRTNTGMNFYQIGATDLRYICMGY